MLPGAAHARKPHWEIAMARRYNRDKNGRFASTGSRSSGPTRAYGTASTAKLQQEQRASGIANRVSRTARRADDAAMSRLSKAAATFRTNPTAANKSAWLKASKERDVAFKTAAQQKGRARKAAERKFGLTR